MRSAFRFGGMIGDALSKLSRDGSWSASVHTLHGVVSRVCQMKHLFTFKKRARRFKIGDYERKVPIVSVLSTNEK
jgi:hypothetical protein